MNSGCQAWQQAPPPAELSCRPILNFSCDQTLGAVNHGHKEEPTLSGLSHTGRDVGLDLEQPWTKQVALQAGRPSGLWG